MPYCYVGTQQANDDAQLNNGLKIFYRTYGHGPTKVLLIIGLASTHDSWGPQIKGLTGTIIPNDDETGIADWNSCRDDNENGSGIEVCVFDNRGIGRSSIPTRKSDYTTKIMARDATALLNHLGWKKAHVFGHSMGAMIACKLAAMVPDRVLSLALLSVTGGGFQCFPKFDQQTFCIAYRFLKAKTPEQRAAVDLDTHYSKEYLEENVGTDTRRSILYQQYVKAISATGMQSSYGFEGQVNACWRHKMTRIELDLIRSAGFLVSVIHGRYDIIAQVYYARRLAERLHPVARMIDLHGGHLVSHERTEEVNQALFDLIKASEVKSGFTSCVSGCFGWTEKSASYFRSHRESGGSVSFTCCMLENLRLCLLYLLGILVLAFECARKYLRGLKPARVRASPSYVDTQ